MSTLHHDHDRVHSDAEPTTTTPEPAASWPDWTDVAKYAVCGGDVDVDEPLDLDATWWAEASDQLGRLTPADVHTDLAWILGQGAYHAGRADTETFCVQGMVAGVLATLARSLRFHRTDSAAACAVARGIDLDRVWIQGVGSRRSALAEALDVEASWYLHQDTPAGTLAAREIQSQADLAEEMNSATAEDWVLDEAAWRMACLESVMENPH